MDVNCCAVLYASTLPWNTGSNIKLLPVTDANAPVALQAARYAIANPYVVTDMSDVKEDLPGNSIGDVDFEEGSKE